MAGKEKSYQIAELWTKSIGEYYKIKCKILAELLNNPLGFPYQ